MIPLRRDCCLRGPHSIFQPLLGISYMESNLQFLILGDPKMTKKIVATFHTVIAFLVQLKNRVKSQFQQFFDMILNALVAWLCRYYQEDMRYC